jgi:N-acetylmuramic acid 6-phosphate etherase
LMRQHDITGADAIIAVAASGNTPFTLACMREAKRRGALAIGIANNRTTPLLDEADFPIWLDTGAEPIAGSTRMKAGTAQRVALNLLSTLVMIRLGRVHKGLMVDVRAINAKLIKRSENILRRLSGCSGEEARDALQRAGGNIKVALLMLHGCDSDQAAALLEQAGGRLRLALRLAGVTAVASSDMLNLSDVPTAVPGKSGEK